MSGKVIVITGASSGIGAALARRLDDEGARLVLAARSTERLAEVMRACGHAIAVPTDVTRRCEVERLRDAAIDAFGHVDVWVNNAGRGIVRDVLMLSDEEFDEMMLVNTKSALYGMQTIVPHFTSREQGHLINVSSLLSRVPAAAFRSAYSAAKAALNILTANLRMDLQRTHPGVHVSLVLPGGVPTNFQKNAIGGYMPAGGAAPPQTADEVAGVIAGVIAEPVPEAYTNPLFRGLVGRYHDDIGAFERGM
jgi:short-subunit dehydrogenase